MSSWLRLPVGCRNWRTKALPHLNAVSLCVGIVGGLGEQFDGMWDWTREADDIKNIKN